MPKLLPKRLSDPRILDRPLLPKRKRSASASDAKLDLIYDYAFQRRFTEEQIFFFDTEIKYEEEIGRYNVFNATLH